MGNTEILSYSKAGFYLAASQAENYDQEFRKPFTNYNYRIVEMQLKREDDEVFLLFNNLKDDTISTKMPGETTIEDAIKNVKKTFENSQGNDESNWRIINRDELTMESTLNEVMEDENQRPIYVAFEVNGLPNFPNSPIRCTQYLAEPFDNNFCYYQFENNGSDSIFQIHKPKQSIIDRFNLERFSKTSCYCNGIDNLFISGGTNQETKEQTNDFWDIDLVKNVVYHHEIGLPITKKNHSMIFIPNQYIFFVGGDDLSTFFYDIQSQTFSKWADLNQKAVSPSLAVYKNRYLISIPNQKNKSGEAYYEYTDLRGLPKWEKKIIKYEDDSEKLQQKYSALCPFGDHHILSVAGIFNKQAIDEVEKSREDLIPVYQISCNVDKEEKDPLEKTDIESKKYTFKEKTFSQLDDDLYGILPIFAKQEPKIVVFDQGRRTFEEKTFAVLEGDQELIGGKSLSVPKFKFTDPGSVNCLKGKLGIDIDLNEPIEVEEEEEEEEPEPPKVEEPPEPPKVEEPPKQEEPPQPNPEGPLRAKKKKERRTFDIDEDLTRNLHKIHDETDYEGKKKVKKLRAKKKPVPEPEPEPEPVVEEPPESNHFKGILLKSSVINKKEDLGVRRGNIPSVAQGRNKQSAVFNFKPGFSTEEVDAGLMKSSVNVGMRGKRSQIYN